MWTEMPKGKNKKPVNKDRFISKMFLRYVFVLVSCNNLMVDSGDSVILSTSGMYGLMVLTTNFRAVLRNQA